ncbi:MAG TPA: hypothetical protein VGM92_14640, partial [Candidatus Kapabacteria bacterium]
EFKKAEDADNKYWDGRLKMLVTRISDEEKLQQKHAAKQQEINTDLENLQDSSIQDKTKRETAEENRRYAREQKTILDQADGTRITHDQINQQLEFAEKDHWAKITDITDEGSDKTVAQFDKMGAAVGRFGEKLQGNVNDAKNWGTLLSTALLIGYDAFEHGQKHTATKPDESWRRNVIPDIPNTGDWTSKVFPSPSVTRPESFQNKGEDYERYMQFLRMTSTNPMHLYHDTPSTLDKTSGAIPFGDGTYAVRGVGNDRLVKDNSMTKSNYTDERRQDGGNWYDIRTFADGHKDVFRYSEANRYSGDGSGWGKVSNTALAWLNKRQTERNRGENPDASMGANRSTVGDLHSSLNRLAGLGKGAIGGVADILPSIGAAIAPHSFAAKAHQGLRSWISEGQTPEGFRANDFMAFATPLAGGAALEAKLGSLPHVAHAAHKAIETLHAAGMLGESREAVGELIPEFHDSPFLSQAGAPRIGSKFLVAGDGDDCLVKGNFITQLPTLLTQAVTAGMNNAEITQSTKTTAEHVAKKAGGSTNSSTDTSLNSQDIFSTASSIGNLAGGISDMAHNKSGSFVSSLNSMGGLMQGAGAQKIMSSLGASKGLQSAIGGMGGTLGGISNVVAMGTKGPPPVTHIDPYGPEAQAYIKRAHAGAHPTGLNIAGDILSHASPLLSLIPGFGAVSQIASVAGGAMDNGVLGSYATGVDSVPKTGEYQLHEGEKVLTRYESQMIRQSGSGSNGSSGPMRLHPEDIESMARAMSKVKISTDVQSIRTGGIQAENQLQTWD